MSEEVVVCAEELGKKYLIGHQEEHGRYTALGDVIGRSVRGLVRSGRDMLRGQAIVPGDTLEEFWALKDVSFEIKRGEVVGILGRNGAGKSTLLKILSGITEPSEGRVTIRGRSASLLEVGTGFHSELTGRENIYLNGAILGMTRAEIRRKFDEIVAFAEVERFLDTPVKRYSSGMYVRLAFSVAAHLEPEILVIDEVLAVGDVEFQKKCLGRMREVAGQGRTILFVSHNMEAVRKLCGRGIVLDEGRIQFEGDAEACVENYILQKVDTGSTHCIQFPETGVQTFHVKRIEVIDQDGNPKPVVRTWDPVVFRIVFHSPRAMAHGAVTLQLSTTTGTTLTFCSTQPDSSVPVVFREGENVVDCRFDQLMLASGHFLIGAGLAVANRQWLANEPHAGTIEIHPKDVYDAGSAPSVGRYLVPMAHSWEVVDK